MCAHKLVFCVCLCRLKWSYYIKHVRFLHLDPAQTPQEKKNGDIPLKAFQVKNVWKHMPAIPILKRLPHLPLLLIPPFSVVIQNSQMHLFSFLFEVGRHVIQTLVLSVPCPVSHSRSLSNSRPDAIKKPLSINVRFSGNSCLFYLGKNGQLA